MNDLALCTGYARYERSSRHIEYGAGSTPFTFAQGDEAASVMGFHWAAIPDDDSVGHRSIDDGAVREASDRSLRLAEVS